MTRRDLQPRRGAGLRHNIATIQKDTHMFNKTNTTTQPATTEGLPAGYNDPESWFYIPEELHVPWVRWASTAPMQQYQAALNLVSRDAAETELREMERRDVVNGKKAQKVGPGQSIKLSNAAIERIMAPVPTHVFNVPASRSQLESAVFVIGAEQQSAFGELTLAGVAGQILANRTEAMNTRALHALRGLWVVEKAAEEKHREEQEAKMHEWYHCSICGETVNRGANTVNYREVITWPSPKPVYMTSCLACFDVAMGEGVRLSALAVPEASSGRTRAELVRNALSA
jgi:hypothetical protein